MDQFRDDAPTGDIVVIHDDKPTGGFEGAGQVESDWRLSAHGQLGDLILLNGFASPEMIEGGRIDNSVDGGDLASDFPRAEAQQILFPAFQGTAAQPKYVGAEGGGDQWDIVLTRGNFTALHKDLLVKRHTDRLPCVCLDR